MPNPTYDVLVIGGGITGAGCALELSRAGYSVLLIEKGDFASGTSSKTTKLIHGGLRYLKTGDFRQVRLGLKARAELLRIAPDLVKPIRIQIPYRSAAERAYLEAGLRLYEALGWPHNTLPRHSREGEMLGPLDASSTRAKGFLSFWDAQTDDTALVFSVMFVAEAHGAEIHNYTDIVSVGREPKGFVLALDDHRLERQFEVSCRVIVNAAGVWSGNVNSLLGCEGAGPIIRMSKGSHIVTTLKRLPLEAGLLIPNDDGRPIFALPWLGCTLIGTTDAEYFEEPSRIAVRREEAEYLLRAVNKLLPGQDLSAADLTGHFAGLRPLVASSRSQTTTELSRRHAVYRKGRIINAAGGKLTTFLEISRLVLRDVSWLVGRKHREKNPLRLPSPFPCTALAQVDEQIAGTTPRWDTFLKLAGPCRVFHLDDLLLRRTHLLLFDRNKVLTRLPIIAAGVASEIGWTEARISEELERVQQLPEARDPFRTAITAR